ncbi:BZ3500_MvSof-1268-A1-R1_Chr6-3g08802 [Microbotryum saponariae]|uniref:BZ3500_MvSof-1268-A1-R1_Chr6-3g08802 protein n=1 Tax=Microbotryum saponariae TaxID=289078 RepID=A0A2X0M5S8_9BASI|nr:BZ3500_MvSof-1268-A1-R1_Chr6-3g08802 [Microbotryum saponariae]SDA07403.1 BZ3501_MvSof-1269-A2-R1_Chr6-2g08505 [Microbotryum saponariae]
MSSTTTTKRSPTKASKSSKGKAALKPSASAPPLGKFLASSEKHIRDKAVASLAKFLSAGHKRTSDADGQDEPPLIVGDVQWDNETVIDKRLRGIEMAKLWKGIFFCFWMSDKPLVQQALAQDLANLTLDVRPKDKDAGRVERFRAALAYLRGFWEAVVREWSGLDRLRSLAKNWQLTPWEFSPSASCRLDKFYLLIRRFVYAAFALLQREEWDPRAIEEYNQLLTGPGGPLHVTDARIPASLAYHLADIYLAEIERICPPVDSPSPVVPVIPLLQPFLTTLALAPSKTLFQRVTSNVTTPLLEDALPAPPAPPSKRRKVESSIEKATFPGIFSHAQEAGKDEVSEEERKEKVGKALLRALFEEGAKSATNEVNRRRLYEIVKQREEAGVEFPFTTGLHSQKSQQFQAMRNQKGAI